ncbi:MAG: glycoside hydrolase family 3 N-terminal domain-containing protein [Clostridia bacterium]|nr:glycoside hydrolase family 3 N-terminal domain-containing protein [Clostridia bacterium]
MSKLYPHEKKHLKMLRELSAECTLLLRKDGTFPLNGPCDLALYGSGARRTIKGGTGSGEVNSRFFINAEEGLRRGGFNIVTEDWLDKYDEIYTQAYKEFIADIKREAKEKHTLAIMYGMGKACPEPDYQIPFTKKCDTAVYVLSRISGEGNDRVFEKGDFLLTDTEVRDINLLNEMYEKFMLVINTGGPVDLSPVNDVKNILVLSQLGVLTGKILSDVILGKLYPSGKLTTTWASPEDYCSIGNFGDRDETFYTEGVYVGYRYFDTVGKKALYPFGFGLGYTDFETGRADIKLDGETVKLSVPVKNIGSHAGKEVVQVYVSAPCGKLDQPTKSLAAFAKTAELLPGESVNVSVEFNMTDIASYDTESESYVLEEGAYIVAVGNSSDNVNVCGLIEVPEKITVRKVRNSCGNYAYEDWKPETRAELEIPEDVEVLILDSSVIVTETVEYDKPVEIDPYVADMSDEDVMYLNIGAFNPKGGLLSVIGSASSSVAGAAGQSANPMGDSVWFPVMVMADGPAGLRISPHYTRDEKGVHSVGGMMPESFRDLLPGISIKFMDLMSKRKPKGEVLDQYCTAIPIGTALAQSFNTDVAETCGDIVGAEMELYGVNLWLAPALNIHRSVLCGRNFEYYSEDPLVSGKMAAGITKGVQKHKGCGTTIKHYCANNQEFNRYFTNSNVSERAMREIYLKGFEVCVKESQPHSLMTSYNLLNGTHTSEMKSLIEDILRSEWGFEGVVMTDWVISMMAAAPGSIYRIGLPSETAKAGNDLFMPGSPSDYKKLAEGLKTGKVSIEELRRNASRVYRMAQKLADR